MLQTQNVDAVIAKVVLFKASILILFAKGNTRNKGFECKVTFQLFFLCSITTIHYRRGIHGNKGTEAAIAAIKMAFIRQGFVDASKSNGPLLSAGAMQLEEGSHLELKE
jgi:6,7-dimethyl-8-ribityllumazine synthase